MYMRAVAEASGLVDRVVIPIITPAIVDMIIDNKDIFIVFNKPTSNARA